MFRVSLITLLIILLKINIFNILCVKGSEPPVHLVLKNVNYIPAKKHHHQPIKNKEFEVLDFSIYVPREINHLKSSHHPKLIPVHETYAENSHHNPTTVSGSSNSNFNTLKKPKTFKGKYQSDHLIQPRFPSQPMNVPHFEALTGFPRPHFEALTGPPPSSPKLQRTHFESMTTHPSQKSKVGRATIQSYNNGYVTASPNMDITTWRPKFFRQKVTPSDYILNLSNGKFRPTTIPQTLFIPSPTHQNLPFNRGFKPQPQFVTTVTTGLAPRFEALTAHKPSGFVIKHTKRPTARHSNLPYYEAITTHDDDKIPKTNFYHGSHKPSNRNQQHHNLNKNERILPAKDLIMNNVVYHEDHYSENQESDNDDGNPDGNQDTRYRVQERSEESKRNYQNIQNRKQPSFYIKVDEIKQPKRKHKKKNAKVEETKKVEIITVTPSPIFQNYSPEPETQESKLTEKIITLPNEEIQQNSEVETDNDKDLKHEGTEMDVAAHAIEDEIRYFQDIFVAQKSPFELEFGHILDSPQRSEERYERNDMENQRYQGKVIWSDKDGGYGEHYWDLGHAKPNS